MPGWKFVDITKIKSPHTIFGATPAIISSSAFNIKGRTMLPLSSVADDLNVAETNLHDLAVKHKLKIKTLSVDEMLGHDPAKLPKNPYPTLTPASVANTYLKVNRLRNNHSIFWQKILADLPSNRNFVIS